MFTVKATYRGETRRLTFGDSPAFPSYDQLYQQLYRVFSGHSFSLSRLIFSPASGQSILIGTEVHSQEEYDAHTAPYKDKIWPAAVLKLTVVDETPRKRPLPVPRRALLPPTAPRHQSSEPDLRSRGVMRREYGDEPTPRRPIAERPNSMLIDFLSSSRPRLSSPQRASLHSESPYQPAYVHLPKSSHPASYQPMYIPSPPPPDTTFVIPPPPCIPPPPVLNTLPQPPPLVVPPPPIIYSSSAAPSPVENMRQLGNAPAAAPRRPSPCCSVEEGRKEIKNMLTNFLRDFERISSSTFGVPVLTGLPAEAPVPAPPTQSAIKESNEPADLNLHIPGSFEHGSLSARSTPVPLVHPRQTSDDPTVIHAGIVCDVCRQTIVGVRHKCMQCPDYDMCTSCYEMPGTMARHRGGHRFFQIEQPDAVVHHNIVCDRCDLTVVGSRHKCLDCQDYDLCTRCLKDVTEFHNPFHSFYEIKEPGRVVVHNVYTGTGEANVGSVSAAPHSRTTMTGRARTTDGSPAISSASASPVLHNATCDLCSSRIEGERYKCLNCPDYDTCSACFSITKEQHPNHGFVRITRRKDLMMRGSLSSMENTRHQATCNACQKVIYGVRYKCMHPSCPDYDLCANCEAHPIPVHPPLHPLLKMKTASTVIPTVYRVGGTELIPAPKVTEPAPQIPMPGSVPITSRRETASPTLPAMFGQWHARDVLEQQEEMADLITMPDSPRSTPSIPRIPNIDLSGDLYRELWPAVASEWNGMVQPMHEQPVDAGAFTPLTPDIKHLLNPIPEESRSDIVEVTNGAPLVDVEMPESTHVTESSLSAANAFTETQSTSGPSPLGAEALLATPLSSYVPTSYAADYMEVLRKLQQDLLAQAQTSPASVGLTSPVTARAVAKEATKNIELTPDFCTQALNPFNDTAFFFSIPKVQVLTVRKVTPTVSYAKETERYRLTVSDGAHFIPALLAPESNHLVTSNAVQKNTVITLDNFATNVVNGKIALEIFAMTVVAQPNEKIGSPMICLPPQAVASPESVTKTVSESESVPSVNVSETETELATAIDATLRASFLSDVNIPDGQVFPPGAEFVKSWLIKNDGEVSWPETTELIWVAGDRMLPDHQTDARVHVGTVQPGEVVTISAPEMKAPEVPGKYVSYWKLSDGTKGRELFGNNVWADINVAEHNNVSDASSEHSLASSSVIMPRPASQDSRQTGAGAAVPSTSSVTAPSDMGSDDSISLINDSDAHSQLSADSDDEIWQDSRSEVVPAQHGEIEYVVLYEEDSSSEDE